MTTPSGSARAIASSVSWGSTTNPSVSTTQTFGSRRVAASAWLAADRHAASTSLPRPVPRPTVTSTLSDANNASATESSWNPLTDETSAAEVDPITATPGKASRTVATSTGSKLSNADTRIPAWGTNPPSEMRHCSITPAIASPGSTSSLCPTAILSKAYLRGHYTRRAQTIRGHETLTERHTSSPVMIYANGRHPTPRFRRSPCSSQRRRGRRKDADGDLCRAPCQ